MPLYKVIDIALNTYRKEPISAIYENKNSFIVTYGMPDFTITLGLPIICISKLTNKISYIEITDFFNILDNYKVVYKVSI